jgi:hypothetical protein
MEFIVGKTYLDRASTYWYVCTVAKEREALFDKYTIGADGAPLKKIGSVVVAKNACTILQEAAVGLKDLEKMRARTRMLELSSKVKDLEKQLAEVKRDWAKAVQIVEGETPCAKEDAVKALKKAK